LPRKAMAILTESMFYVLMALKSGPKCGIEIADAIERLSGGRLRMGPATLYTILSKFEQEKAIRETQVEGRKRTYCITRRGLDAYEAEIVRLRQCVADAQQEDVK